jgi:hypothetical protein
MHVYHLYHFKITCWSKPWFFDYLKRVDVISTNACDPTPSYLGACATSYDYIESSNGVDLY